MGIKLGLDDEDGEKDLDGIHEALIVGGGVGLDDGEADGIKLAIKS